MLEIISPVDTFLAPIAASVFAIFALFWVGISLYSLDFLSLIPAIFWLLASLNTFISGTEFQENGLMINNDFIEWERIESFSWIHRNKKEYVLIIKHKRQLAFLDFGIVPFKLKVPIEKKAEIETIFERYLPGKLSSVSA